MTKYERQFHAHQCHIMLTGNNVKLSTKTGKYMVYAYYMGVLATTENPPAYITMCLYSGRYEDLVSDKEPVKDES